MPDDFANQSALSLTVQDLINGILGSAVFANPSTPAQGPEQEFLKEAALKISPLENPIASLVARLKDAPQHDALHRMADALSLSDAERATVLLCLQVETQPIMGRAMAFLQAPVGGARPTLGLIAALFSGLSDVDTLAPEIALGPAVRSGLLQMTETGPLPERHVWLGAGIVSVLTGNQPAWPGVQSIAAQPDIHWPPSLKDAVAKLGSAMDRDSNQLFLVRSLNQHDRREVGIRLAACLDRTAVFISLDAVDKDGLGAFCTGANALPVFTASVGPGERKALPAMQGYTGPILAFLGPEGSVGRDDLMTTEWALPLPSAEERTELWASSIEDKGLAALLGKEHLQTSGRIKEICGFAAAEARLQGKDAPDLSVLKSALWLSDGAGLGALAQPVKDEIPDEAMITSEGLARDLDFLLVRCKNRERLSDGLGASLKARYKVGVRSLFAGPSGTGKTLAAGWLAGKLHLPLYRVDLAAVSSKYIGETEKNLSNLLAKAEEMDVVLLFDEADSLFGKRTDITDSNDRFANAQTNYLLQRIETFSGIVLLTSNAKNRFDEAFTRRIDTIVDFVQPEAEERLALWRAHLGEGHGLSVAQLNRLAALADLAGGYIRNVVLVAAVLAARDETPISYAHIVEGLKSEYRKLGWTVPSELLIAEVRR